VHRELPYSARGVFAEDQEVATLAVAGADTGVVKPQCA
jgi:hypothetical protein